MGQPGCPNDFSFTTTNPTELRHAIAECENFATRTGLLLPAHNCNIFVNTQGDKRTIEKYQDTWQVAARGVQLRVPRRDNCRGPSCQERPRSPIHPQRSQKDTEGCTPTHSSHATATESTWLFCERMGLWLGVFRPDPLGWQKKKVETQKEAGFELHVRFLHCISRFQSTSEAT